MDDPYELHATAMPLEQRRAALTALAGKIRSGGTELGWQVTWNVDYGDFTWLIGGHINNIGDPFDDNEFSSETKAVERAVLDYFAELWGIPPPHDPQDRNSYWGFLLTMGASEGNIYGLWNARDYFLGKDLLLPEHSSGDGVEPREPVLLYSVESHYSVGKTAHVLLLETPADVGARRYPGQCPIEGEWPQGVPATGGGSGPGTIDVHALRALVEFFAARHHPVIVVLNAGTTFKGACDDIAAVNEILAECYSATTGPSWQTRPGNGGRPDRRRWYWIHVDGALGAAYLPFFAMAPERADLESGIPVPAFDFAVPGVCSMVVSAHKWIGSPWPGGVYLTRNHYRMRPPPFPEYVGSADTMLAGSRNGQTAVVMWNFLARNSYETQTTEAVTALRLAQYTEAKLSALQHNSDHVPDLWVGRSPWSLSIRFRRPAQDIVDEFGLSGMRVQVQGADRAYVHLYIMRDTPRDRIDALIRRLAEPGAF
ncbi:pyridoxal-dependent decarboxylase [Nocardia sp. NPDC048505]|uniref:pyridoxal-dependent decarboxylase n=1 Tax=Nocardia sp. NPDC048505 TaxID=3155756 RepID=UPI0033DE5F66